MRKQAEMSIEVKENGQYIEHIAYPYVEYDHVTFENGMQIEKALEDDVAMPTVAHDTSSFKVGQGDSDVSDSIVDSSVASMTIKGQTYQNILPSPSLRNSMTDGNTMQKINEGYDSVEVVDGELKSAILKGQTLVNLSPTIEEFANLTWDVNDSTALNKYGFRLIKQIQPNKTYFFRYVNAPAHFSEWYFAGIGMSWSKNNCKFTTNSDVNQDHASNFMIRTTQGFTEEEISNMQIIICEYQEGMENWDIPYFEGMQSVKMPVLTTVGKNLFDGIMTSGQLLSNNVIQSNQTKMGYSEFLPVNGELDIYCSFYTNSVYIIEKIYFYDENKNQISMNTRPGKVTTPKGTKYFRISVTTSDWNSAVVFDDIKDDFNIQVETGIQATTYEPYKSNILTVNEPVELRGIGDVRDELNLLTGEMTERIGEVVLDGTNTPYIMFLEPNRAEGYTVFPMQISDVFPNMTANYNYNTQLISNNFNYLIGGYVNRLGGKWMCINAMYFVLSIPNDELESFDVQGLNKWLSLNKTTIYYPSKKSIKTVDLSILNQDNQPVEQLQSYANGHIQLSSNVAEGEYSLTPSIEYEVPTSNSYHLDLAKPNTQYTMKNMTGTFTLDGTQYNASANGTFTTPSTLTNKFMVASVAQSQPMLLEGDMTSEEVPYIEGIKSAFDGVDKVEIVSQNADNTLTNTTSFPITNPLRSLPNGVRDEVILDRQNHKAKLIQRVGEDLTQLATPIITEVDIEGFPYVYKDGHIFLNTEVAPATEVKYSINQSQIIESQSEDIVRHSKEIDNLYNLIATYVQVNYDSTLLNLKTKGV